MKGVGTRGNVTGTAVREYFANYFTSPLGSSLAFRKGLKYLVLHTQKMIVLFLDKHSPTDNTVHGIFMH